MGHSAGADFTLELADKVIVTIHCHDVALFDMVGGTHSCNQAFTDAPGPWQGFVLAHGLGTKTYHNRHVLPTVTGDTELKFCECALPVGAMVTCVGELVRDRF